MVGFTDTTAANVKAASLTCITGYGTQSAAWLGCYSCDTGTGSLSNGANSNAARYSTTTSCVITTTPALTALTSANCALGYFPSGTTPY